jgi:hypothetical protein
VTLVTRHLVRILETSTGAAAGGGAHRRGGYPAALARHGPASSLPNTVHPTLLERPVPPASAPHHPTLLERPARPPPHRITPRPIHPTDTQQLELTGYAIQHLLQHYTPDRLVAARGVAPPPLPPAAPGKHKGGGAPPAAGEPGPGAAPVASAAAAEPGSLFSLLPEDIQPIVAPYLTTKFTLGAPKPSNDPMRGEGCLRRGTRGWGLAASGPQTMHCAAGQQLPRAPFKRPSRRYGWLARPAPPAAPPSQRPSLAATRTPSGVGCTCG